MSGRREAAEMEEEERSLEASLREYRSQLIAVESTMTAIGGEDVDENKADLLELKSKLKTIIAMSEQDLLAIKKKRLLRELGVEEDGPSGPGEDPSAGPGPSSSTSQSTPGDGGEGTEEEESLEAALNLLEGNKCRAPFRFESGRIQYYNALIMNVEAVDEERGDIKVRVLFTHPFLQQMRSCPFFLEGKCRYESRGCRFSHGLVVSLNHLREFEDMTCSPLQKDSRCLVFSSDEQLWQECLVEKCLQNDRLVIKYVKTGESGEVSLEELIPFDDDHEEEEEAVEEGSEDEDEEQVVASLVLNETSNCAPSAALGGWEVHTKGIGSKLMKKMGYIWGQGLGKEGEGRIEPIEARIIPAGKSLDVCMELREKAASCDDLKRKKRALKKKADREAKIANGYYRIEPKNSLFAFLNRKVGLPVDDNNSATEKEGGGGGGDGSGGETGRSDVRQPLHKELKGLSKESLHIRAFKVAEELRKEENQLESLTRALDRNKSRDKVAYGVLLNKTRQQQEVVQKLQRKENALQKEQQTRFSDHKLTVF